MTQKTVWRYGVHCYGIKKKCRKPDFHSVGTRNPLKETDKEPSQEEAVSLARSWIFRNMKTCSKATATITRWTLEGDIEKWEPFNDADNIKINIDQISYAAK